jgi:hypothetical protein
MDRIQVIAPSISSEPHSGALQAPEAQTAQTHCFSNAKRKAREPVGGVLFGRMFHFREMAALAGGHYLIAVRHAVWHAPDKKLIDVTPLHADPKHRQIVVNAMPWCSLSIAKRSL